MASKKKAKEKSLDEVELKDIGFVRTFIGFLKTRLMGIPDPIYEKVVLYKKVRKKLKAIPIKGINFSKERITPEFGKILFEIYRYFYSLRKLIDFSKPSQINSFIDFLVKHVSSEEQKEKLKQLTSEDFIKEKISTMKGKAGAKELKSLYKDFNRSFSNDQIQRINHIFSLGDSFYHFLKFDIYVLLKKFAPDIKEDNIFNPPAFRDVDFHQIKGLLKDFTDHLYMLNPDGNYYEFIELFGNHIGSDIIPQEDFQKFFSILQRLIKSNYMVLMVQYVGRDVFFRPLNTYSKKKAMSDYFRDIAELINKMQSKITSDIKNGRINQILEELFGTTRFMELTNYLPEQNDYLVRSNAGSFPYVDVLNVLKKFLLDKYNHYLRKTLHSFILKATFSAGEFQEEMNTIYYKMNELVETMLEFEKKMDGKDGWKRIQNLIRSRARDSSLAYLAKKYITEINMEVGELLDNFIKLSGDLKEKLKIVVTAFNQGEKTPVANIKKFAGTQTPQIVKNLAQGFNDISKVLTYFKIAMK